MIYRPKRHSLFNADKYHIRATIVFRSANTKWLKRILKDGFSHCFVIIHHNGYNLMVNSCFSHAYNSLSFQEYTPQEGDTIVKIDRLIDTNVSHYKIGLMSCVEIVKRFIGLNRFLVFTPYQLYKALQRGY